MQGGGEVTVIEISQPNQLPQSEVKVGEMLGKIQLFASASS